MFFALHFILGNKFLFPKKSAEQRKLHIMVFTTEGFFEVAIESWPEWDLNPRPLNSVQTLKPTELYINERASNAIEDRNDL